MKKKIFLAIAIVAMLTCLFAISISAAEPEVTVGETTYKFGTVTTVEDMAVPTNLDTTSRILVKDSDGTLITYPAYYFLPDSTTLYNSNTIDTSSGALKAVKVTKTDGTVYSAADIIMLEIPNGVNKLSTDGLFSTLDSMVYLSLPSITSYGNEKHFAECTALKVVDLSRAVDMTYTSTLMFYKCSALDTIIWPVVPEGQTPKLTSLSRGSFAYTALTSVAVPEGVKNLGDNSNNQRGVFSYCEKLTSITLPSTLEVIGRELISYCPLIETFEFPSTVKSIYSYAFNGCTGLKTVKSVDVGTTATITSLGELFSDTTLSSIESITILQPISGISQNCFSGQYNTKMKTATINLTSISGSIGNRAFYLCAGLKIGDLSGATSIGQYAFYQTNLSGAIDLSGATKINQQAFYQCTGITNVKFGENLTEIYAEAFRDCTSLVFVDFGDGDNALTFKAHRTFYNCSSLKAVSLPKNTTYMGNGTFATCDVLGAVYLGESLEYLAGNKGDNASDGPCFADNPNMYFVQKPFDVIKADGTFYSADEFVQPEKPDIYYFPSTLKAIVATGNLNHYFRLYDFTYTYTTTTVTDESTGKTKTVYVLNVDENGYPVMSYGSYNVPNINTNVLVCDKDGNVIINEYMYLFEYERDENGDLILTEVTESGKYYMRATIKRDADGNIVYRLDENGERIKLYDDKGVAITGMYDDGMTRDSGAADRAIVNCKNLNSVLVFPEDFTGVYDGTQSRDENQRGDSLGSGMITKCATADNPITLVFLGRIDRVSMDRRNGDTSYMTYMFANLANTGFENTQVATYYTPNNTYYSNQNEMYVIFCHAEGGAQKYKINFEGSSDNAYYPVLNATIQVAPENENWHIYEPGTDYESEATCTLPAGEFKLCFCGKVCYSNVVEGSEPLGHSDIDATIVYYYKDNNYFETSYKKFTCTREGCGEEIDKQNGIPALFIAKGMTVPDYGVSALCHAIKIDLDAVKEYNAFLGEGNEIKYGVLAGVAVDGNKPVGADGKSNCDAIVMGFESTNFSIVQLKLTGLEKANKQLYCGAYVVVDGTVSYLYEGTVSEYATPLTVNNGILDQTTPEATVEETKENA